MAMVIKLALLGNELEARAAPAATAILRSHPLSDKKVADKGKGSSELRASFGEEGGRQSSLVNEVYRFPSPLVDIVIFVFAGGGGGGGEKEMNDFLSLPAFAFGGFPPLICLAAGWGAVVVDPARRRGY